MKATTPERHVWVAKRHIKNGDAAVAAHSLGLAASHFDVAADHLKAAGELYVRQWRTEQTPQPKTNTRATPS